jgi:hypothetical protein
MVAYKFTGPGAVGVFTGFHWPVPRADGTPGAWVRPDSELEVCVAGVHACRILQLAYWIAPELWEIELGGEVIESTHKVVASAGRLRRRVAGWPSVEREFAEACAARTLDLAVSALREAELHDEAETALAARSAAELSAAADAADAAAGCCPPLVANLIGYAADCAMDIDHGYYTMCAYVAATAFANHSTGDVVQDMSSDGWVEERSRQARWLAGRLDLAG